MAKVVPSSNVSNIYQLIELAGNINLFKDVLIEVKTYLYFCSSTLAVDKHNHKRKKNYEFLDLLPFITRSFSELILSVS